MSEIPRFLARKTAEPDFHQIYRFVEECEGGELLYHNHSPGRIYKSRKACEAAIAKLEAA